MTWKYLRRYLDYHQLTYQQYLSSEHWQDVRRRFWASKLHDGRCFACAAGNKPLEVHHRSYKRIGREYLRDLCLMCRDCHQATHDWANTPYKKMRAGTRLFVAAKKIRTLMHGKRNRRRTHGR